MALSSKAYSQQDIQYLQESDTLYINVCTEGVTEGRIRAYASFPYRSYGGWVVIEGEAGEELTLDGSYGIWDGELRIWDGRPGSGGVLLADYSWVGSNTLELTANSGVFVIWFHTDTGDDEQMDFVWRSLHPELCCDERPSDLTVTTAAEADGSCTATLNWQTSAPAGTGYRISLNGVPVDTTMATTAMTTAMPMTTTMRTAIAMPTTTATAMTTAMTAITTTAIRMRTLATTMPTARPITASRAR